MTPSNDINSLLANLPGARLMSALELNDVRFSGRKTVITPGRLRTRKDSGKK